jgi:thioesterase domain-containing protein
MGEKVSALVLFEFYSPHAFISRKSMTYKKRRFAYYKDRVRSLNEAKNSWFDLVKFVAKKSSDSFNKKFVKAPPPKYITNPAYRTYIYKPYSGKVILVQASIPPVEVNNSPLMGWTGYFTGDVKQISIKGGHLGILREPAVADLAKELQKVLNDAEDS